MCLKGCLWLQFVITQIASQADVNAAEVEKHVREAWAMEIDTRNFFATPSSSTDVEDQSELHAAVVRHGRERRAAGAAESQEALDARRAGRSDHVAALVARRAALEAEVSAIRAAPR